MKNLAGQIPISLKSHVMQRQPAFVSRIVVAALFSLAGAVQAQAPGDPVPDRYIVVLQAGANPSGVANRHGVAAEHVYSAALNGFAGAVPAGRLRALLRDPQVAWVEQDQVVTAFDKPVPPSPQPPQTVPTGVLRVNADMNTTAKINGSDERVDVDIAIIDTGIQLNHPDLNVVANVSFVFVRGKKTGDDDHGHGTHVAGIAAALDNGIGVVGVAPGARLWAVKVLNSNGSGTLSDVIAGVDYVTAHAAEIEVANMSLGGGNSEALKSAIANSAAAGVVYAVAAGNGNADAANTSPANSDHVLCVSAIVDTDGQCGGLGGSTAYGDDDTRASFSNFGSVVDIAAPGVNILSTYKGSTYAGGWSGTSMASPHVAGAVALYLATNHLKPTDAAGAAAVRDAIIAAGVDQAAGCVDPLGGFGGDFDGYPEKLLNAMGL